MAVWRGACRPDSLISMRSPAGFSQEPWLPLRLVRALEKSVLALDFMRSCSLRHRMASVIFSLEMSKSEIVMRLLAAEARVKLADMRSGRMNDDDWIRVGGTMSQISDARIRPVVAVTA